MITISFWAKAHPGLARILIVILHLLLGLLAIEMALELKNLGLDLPAWPLWVASAAVLYHIIVYPRQKTAADRKVFRRQRMQCDLALIIAGWVLLLGLSNRDLPAQLPVRPQAQLSALRLEGQESSLKRMFRPLNPFVQKNKPGTWRTFVRKHLEERRAELAGQKKLTLLKVLLLLLFSAASITILAYLSCSLACSELGALAILVALGGLVGIVALLCMFLRQTLPDDTKRQRLGKALLFLLGGIALTFLLF
jgi:hypothetical protein